VIAVNSLHHQGIKDLAPGLRASAWSPDGLVEAIESETHPCRMAVQWHPENLAHSYPEFLNIFKWLVEYARDGHAATERGAIPA
jgi:putative glutamine amidotransferase